MMIGGYSYISEQDFDEQWGAHAKPNGDLYAYHEVQSLPIEHVWTVSEGDDVEAAGFDIDDHWYASPGVSFVNALGYVITGRAWS